MLRLILSALWQALTVNQQRYFWPCHQRMNTDDPDPRYE